MDKPVYNMHVVSLYFLVMSCFLGSVPELLARPERHTKEERRQKFEAFNYHQAYGYAYRFIHKTRKDVYLKDILYMHYLLLRNIDTVHAGKLRTSNVKLLSLPHVRFPDHQRVAPLMHNYVEWLHKVEGDPVKIAIQAFCKLVLEIHPFADGNGRTSRLLMNLLLMQAGYKPLHFHKKINPDEYYNQYIPALNKVLFYKNYRDFETLIRSRLKLRD